MRKNRKPHCHNLLSAVRLILHNIYQFGAQGLRFVRNLQSLLRNSMTMRQRRRRPQVALEVAAHISITVVVCMFHRAR